MLALSLFALMACKGDPQCPDEGEVITCQDGVALTCDAGRVRDQATCGGNEVCADDLGCVSCDLDLPLELSVPIDTAESPAAWRTLGWRAIPIGSAGGADLTVEGPFSVHDADGVAITELVLPTTVFVRATGGGTGHLAIVTECGTEAEIGLVARADPGLTVTPRDTLAAASFVSAFPVGATIRVGLDPLRHTDRIGVPAFVWIVEDRDREAWLEDPVLVDAVGEPRLIQVVDGGLDDNLFDIWVDATAEPGTVGRYDVVLDFDGDGLLGPGDLIDGLDGTGFGVVPDLAENGPYTPEIEEVSASFFLTQRVYWPAEIESFSEPLPLVVISHGNGHEYDWYDYLGEQLASWGYVVMAHRNDTAPGVQSAATTTLTNTDGFVRNYAQLDPALDGRVDTSRIVWVGHSRGGEGILLAHERLRTGSASVQALQASDIVLLSSIAPTVFEDPRQASPGNVPMHLLSGSADGDVTGGVGNPVFPGPCELCQWWRLLQDGSSRQYVTYLHGSIHNDFNCCGVNDGNGVISPKLGRIDTLRYVRSLYVALLAHELHGDAVLGEYLHRMPTDLGFPHPPAFPVVTQSRIALGGPGLMLDDFQANPELDVSSSGTAVRTDIASLIEGVLDDGNSQFTHTPGAPMNGMTQSDGDAPNIAARGAVFEWDGAADWEVDLPEEARDVSTMVAISLRMAQATRHPITVDLDDRIDFGIVLVDGSGTEVELPTAAYGRVSTPYPRGGLGAGIGWANEFNTIRIPLADFETLGLDRTDVRTVRLRFGPAHGSFSGRVGLDDVALEVR